MQIQLSQADIEIAVRSYILEMGITRSIDEITFSQTRNPAGILAEIQLDRPSEGASPALVGGTDSPLKSAPPKAVAGRAEDEVDEAPEATTQSAPAEDETATAEEPPFEKDEAAPAKSSSKNSLFG